MSTTSSSGVSARTQSTATQFTVETKLRTEPSAFQPPSVGLQSLTTIRFMRLVTLSTPSERFIPHGWRGELRLLLQESIIVIELADPQGTFRAEHRLSNSRLPVPHTETLTKGPLNVSFLDEQMLTFARIRANSSDSRAEKCHPAYQFEAIRDCWAFQEHLRRLKLLFCCPTRTITSNLRPDPKRGPECRNQDIRLWIEPTLGSVSLTYLSRSDAPQGQYQYSEKWTSSFKPFHIQQIDSTRTRFRLLAVERSSSSVSHGSEGKQKGLSLLRRARALGSGMPLPAKTLEWLEIAFGTEDELSDFVNEVRRPREPGIPVSSSGVPIAELDSPK